MKDKELEATNISYLYLPMSAIRLFFHCLTYFLHKLILNLFTPQDVTYNIEILQLVAVTAPRSAGPRGTEVRCGHCAQMKHSGLSHVMPGHTTASHTLSPSVSFLFHVAQAPPPVTVFLSTRRMHLWHPNILIVGHSTHSGFKLTLGHCSICQRSLKH